MIRWLRRIRFWLRRRALADELRREIETHRALRENALARAGESDPAAASRRALGNVALALDDARDVWGWPWVESLGRDARQALRTLRREPGFAAAALLTIAVGTGTMASVLALCYAVLLRPTPYPTADRLVQIEQVIGGRDRDEVSAPDVAALTRAAPSLSHVTLAWTSAVSLSGRGLPERAQMVYTTAAAFPMLGVAPAAGRWPTTADEAPEAAPVAVIGHRLWTSQFDADPSVVGETIRVDGRAYQVIAVMPRGFDFPAPYWTRGDLWLLRGATSRDWPDSRDRIMLAFGLVAPGASRARAQAEADATALALDAQYPAAGRIGLRLAAWAESYRADAQPRLRLILGAAAIVLLIVCVNVANLLLGRGVDRERELAVRAAMGAGTTRLMRQIVTETAVLFLAGGAGGLLLALWGSRLIAGVRSYSLPRLDEAGLDPPVAVATLAVTMVAALAVGFVPALQIRSARLAGGGVSRTRGASVGRRWRRLQRILVAAEIALSLVLLSGAGVLLEGARRQARVDPGFAVDGLIQARVTLPRDRYATAAEQRAFFDRVQEAVAAIPGVTAAGLVDVPPGVGGSSGPQVLLDGDPGPKSPRDLRVADLRVAGAGYLETLGVTPVSGRFFEAADRTGPPVAVVNETFARTYFGAGTPGVGRRLRVASRGTRTLDAAPRTVVGVMPDLKESTLYEPTPPTVYVPLAQADRLVSLRMTIVARSVRPAGDLAPLLRAAAAEADADQAAFDIRTLDARMQDELSLNRFGLALVGTLAAVSLFLALVGVHGVSAHAARHRTREIGIRLALGASPRTIRRLFLAEGGWVLVPALLSGGVAGVWAAGLLRSAVYGIDATSPATFALAGGVLAVAALAGALMPARRASRVDPSVVLRVE